MIKKNYGEAIELVNNKGIDKFLEALQEEFIEYDLYSCSTAWMYDKGYICKAKGVYGDVVIKWE